MASDEVRVYAVVFADFPAGSISDEDWSTLFGAGKRQPLSAAILDAARGRGAQHFIQTHKHSQNATALGLYTILGFELDRDDVDDLLVVLDDQADVYGVIGNSKVQFEGVLQGELRDAALGLGYTQQQADRLHVTLINDDIPNTFERMTAIAQAQAYLAANPAIWPMIPSIHFEGFATV